MDRAPRVCATCKARKKGCDKSLPICGYCSHRGLICIYEDSPPNHAKSWDWGHTRITDVTRFPRLSNIPSGFASSTNTEELAVDLQDLLYHILECTGQTFTEVCDSYFNGFNRWLPIISHDNLEQVLARYEGIYAPSEISLLMLSILLVVMHPEDGLSKRAVSPTMLYPELKATFTRLQSYLPTTSHMVQVGLILIAYEYASGRLNEAYISIGTCTRIAQVVGIRGVEYSHRTSSEELPCLKDEEEQNIRWGLIFLERLILLECPPSYQDSAQSFPSHDALLPSDLHRRSSLMAEPFSHHKSPTLQDFHAIHVSCFGRQIQATSLLDKVVQATSLPRPPSFSKLRALDDDLQELCTIIMGQSVHGYQCGASGIVIRSLIRLHRYILDSSDSISSEISSPQIREYSHATLKTLSRMMAEIAHDHIQRLVPDRIDSLPLTCSYNMRTMGDFIEYHRGNSTNNVSPTAVDDFATLYEVARKRWPYTV